MNAPTSTPRVNGNTQATTTISTLLALHKSFTDMGLTVDQAVGAAVAEAYRHNGGEITRLRTRLYSALDELKPAPRKTAKPIVFHTGDGPTPATLEVLATQVHSFIGRGMYREAAIRQVIMNETRHMHPGVTDGQTLSTWAEARSSELIDHLKSQMFYRDLPVDPAGEDPELDLAE